jgi:DNA-directed RNA polymerase subunit M/transcription elongation factor TFIIS
VLRTTEALTTRQAEDMACAPARPTEKSSPREIRRQRLDRRMGQTRTGVVSGYRAQQQTTRAHSTTEAIERCEQRQARFIVTTAARFRRTHLGHV